MTEESQEHREIRLAKQREYARAYYAANADKARRQALARYHAGRDAALARKAIYRTEHPDVDKAYYIANIDRIRERHRENSRAWRIANPGRTAEYMRARRAADPDGVRERNTINRRSWAAANRDKARLAVHRACVKRVQADGDFSHEDWLALVTACGAACLWCQRPEGDVTLHIDHIVPLARGGTNWIWNLQPLCESCNKRKHARIIVDYRPRHVRERFGPHD